MRSNASGTRSAFIFKGSISAAASAVTRSLLLKPYRAAAATSGLCPEGGGVSWTGDISVLYWRYLQSMDWRYLHSVSRQLDALRDASWTLSKTYLDALRDATWTRPETLAARWVTCTCTRPPVRRPGNQSRRRGWQTYRTKAQPGPPVQQPRRSFYTFPAHLPL